MKIHVLKENMRRLTLIISLMFFALYIQAKTYIVCAGIADYPGTRNDLRVSANDAVTIAHIFAKNNNAEGLYYTNQDATIANVLNGMNQVFSKANTNDVVIFYFIVVMVFPVALFAMMVFCTISLFLRL